MYNVAFCNNKINSYSASRDNWCTVGGDGGCRVSKVRASTTSPMPDHKGFKLQQLVNFQKFSTLRVNIVIENTVYLPLGYGYKGSHHINEWFLGFQSGSPYIYILCIHSNQTLIAFTKFMGNGLDYSCVRIVRGELYKSNPWVRPWVGFEPMISELQGRRPNHLA